MFEEIAFEIAKWSFYSSIQWVHLPDSERDALRVMGVANKESKRRAQKAELV